MRISDWSSDVCSSDLCLGEIVGDEMGGMRAMFVMMNNARLMIGCQGIQIGERATQQAQRFAAERVQSSLAGSADRTPVTIDQHPDVRRMLWRMRAQTEAARSEEHTSELPSLMRISYAVFCLKQKNH